MLIWDGVGSAILVLPSVTYHEDRRVLTHRPEHGEIVEMLIGFAKDIDTLVFHLSQMVHRDLSVDSVWGSSGLLRPSSQDQGDQSRADRTGQDVPSV